MSAEPAPKRPPNQKRDFITTFRDEYGLALVNAEVSAEHTATQGRLRRVSSSGRRITTSITLMTCARL